MNMQIEMRENEIYNTICIYNWKIASMDDDLTL